MMCKLVGSPLTDAEGREVVLSLESWDHIVEAHPEVEPYLAEICATVEGKADLRSPDPRSRQHEIVWRRGVGPSEWLRVVVKYVAGDRGYIVSARGSRRSPEEQL